jgi:hypothetical protein
LEGSADPLNICADMLADMCDWICVEYVRIVCATVYIRARVYDRMLTPPPGGCLSG